MRQDECSHPAWTQRGVTRYCLECGIVKEMTAVAKMEHAEKKIRDRVIFAYGMIPTVVNVQRHVVTVGLQETDVERTGVDLEEVEKALAVLIDRKVVVEVIANEVK